MFFDLISKEGISKMYLKVIGLWLVIEIVIRNILNVVLSFSWLWILIETECLAMKSNALQL